MCAVCVCIWYFPPRIYLIIIVIIWCFETDGLFKYMAGVYIYVIEVNFMMSFFAAVPKLSPLKIFACVILIYLHRVYKLSLTVLCVMSEIHFVHWLHSTMLLVVQLMPLPFWNIFPPLNVIHREQHPTDFISHSRIANTITLKAWKWHPLWYLVYINVT